ncbi:hypothetical protein [Leptospira mtsangambouensis]|uniref:hypothetical protein n=1 Tax=Leptospira mtsangambouensis TaxID=2484912 RepID=UPI001EEACBD2|nr:hypothetical protein [Leptospira mtsangambouensis]MCG6141656.1 hypothetical protein [Leptospira mtsangambouensis]
MPVSRNLFPFFYRMQWQTFKTIWKSLKASEVIPFLFRFFRERFRLQRSTFWKECKQKPSNHYHLQYPLELIAFYLAYKEVTNNERALFLLLKILKHQSAGVFLEMVEIFRKHGIKITKA